MGDAVELVGQAEDVSVRTREIIEECYPLERAVEVINAHDGMLLG